VPKQRDRLVKPMFSLRAGLGILRLQSMVEHQGCFLTGRPYIEGDIESGVDAPANLPAGQGGFAKADVAVTSNQAASVGPLGDGGPMHHIPTDSGMAERLSWGWQRGAR
jgi:hypothetical protein